MGLLSRVFGRDTAGPVTTWAGSELVPYVRHDVAVASPWSTGELATIVARDIFGPEVRLPLTRAEGMGVPAAARARHLLCGDLANAPLRSLTGPDVDPAQPRWLTRTDRGNTWQRMAWTVDDVIWHGESLWAVERESTTDGSRGAILDAERVPYESWSVDEDGTILYLDVAVAADSVVHIPGPHEGVLAMARESIRIARDLEATVADRARNPTPTTELHQTTEDGLTKAEAAEYVEHWRQARAKRGGTVAFTPYNLDVRVHGDADGQLLIDARNASAIDVVRYIGVPAAMVDASNVNSTLTYETLQGRNLEYVDRCVAMYAGAIAARLSQDDVVARGHRVAFDLSQLTATIPAPTGAPRED